MAAHSLERKAGNRSPLWRLFQLVILISFVALLGLVTERVRGIWLLQRWEAVHVLPKPQNLWPVPSVAARDFFNQLTQTVARLPQTVPGHAAVFQTSWDSVPPMARRASQEPLYAGDQPGVNGNWETLGVTLRESGPVFQELRRLLMAPPSGLDYSIQENLAMAASVNYHAPRAAAQWLQTAALYELRQSNLTNALENLIALAHTSRLRAEDPCLASYMNRIALVGLYDAACWDALQADGWTDQQLALLQQACEDAPELSQIPAVFRAEQSAHLYNMRWFRATTYKEWLHRYEPVARSFGVTSTPMSRQLLNQWVRHPAWTFAWADLETVGYLQHTENDFTITRKGTETASWLRLKEELSTAHKGEVKPGAPWRFYIRLPLVEEVETGVGAGPSESTCAYTDWSKAWFAAFRRLTQHHMLQAAIALKRYKLRHGNLPSDLSSLSPELLAGIPLDLMNGQPLRYHLNADNTFALYSVGLNGQDDGGDPSSEDSQTTPNSYLDAKDWLWPRLDVRPNLSKN